MSSGLVKRPREDEAFGEPGDRGPKKSRFDRNIIPIPSNSSLAMRFPFRTAPLSPALQPTEFAGENGRTIPDDTNPEPFGQWREEKKNTPSWQARRPPALILNTAMDVDTVEPSPLPTGDSMSPWPASARTKASSHPQPSPIPHHLLSQSLTISGGRMSTPVHSHFTINMTPELMTDSSQDTGALKPADECSWWRRRRLPSPISEAGGESPAEPLQDLENSPKETTTTSNWPDSPSSMDVDGDGDGEGDASSNAFLQVPEQNLEVAAHFPENKNTQSEANSPSGIHSGTTVPNRIPLIVPRREKISFSMGYRADCEKCQMKVPGHYSHIVRS